MKVSALSFGASSLGGVFHQIKEEEAIEAVFAAIDGGMNSSMSHLITVIIRQKRCWARHSNRLTARNIT